MPINNSLPPSLLNEITEMQRRISALERKPEPITIFDRYPATEWAATPRGEVAGNIWSSVGIASVTGLVFDRIECKFITDRIIQGRAEAEIRLAAFRHNGNDREIVSASATYRISGHATRHTGVGHWRWIHGIPFGWDYEDETTIYTIELQHRYAAGPTPDVPTRRQVFAFNKAPETSAPAGGALAMPNNTDYATAVLSENRPGVSLGWVPVADPGNLIPYDGSYSISNMHYCVGLPESRLPEATTGGYFYYRGTSNVEVARGADVSEPYFKL